MLPACHCPEGKSVCTHEVWSWRASQTQQVCRSILRTAKCSWVLQFVHAHGVPNSVCLHEGTLSAGVKLYFTLLSLKALLIFTLKEKKNEESLSSFSSYLSYLYVVFCSLDKPFSSHSDTPQFSFTKGSIPQPHFPVSRKVFSDTAESWFIFNNWGILEIFLGLNM